jgi:hypothetical protein
MKRFANYITEANKKTDDDCPEKVRDICELLSLKTSTAFMQLYNQTGEGESIVYGYDFTDADSCYDKHKKVLDNNYKCIDAIQTWFESEKEGKARFMPEILKMAACPNKGPWACWEGTGYRGLAKSKEWTQANKLVFTGEALILPSGEGKSSLWLGAEGVYKSKYPAQSWSSKWANAARFATGNYDTQIFNIVVEMPLTRQNTFLSPDITNKISGYGESEIIRIGNAPTKCQMYVETTELNRIIRRNLFYIIPVRTKLKKQDLIPLWTKELSKLIGEKNAKTVMSNPKYLKTVSQD